MAYDESVMAQMREIIERYPNSRSAVMPLLHLASCLLVLVYIV